MIIAKRSGAWRTRYEISAGGRVIATWDSARWANGGDFEFDGRRFQVRSNGWGTRYIMTDAAGTIIATADRIGRRRWTVEADGQTYHFQRRSLWSNDQELRVNGQLAGSVRQTGRWRADVAIDLPGLPLPTQIFVMSVVSALWQAQATAAA
ncbi:hypothetical protein [Micromonospora endolithica]|uniref:Uncharacterized protein n=1 Tax=Micromonospora endolithica TaxID=230091 RepID=A0A3A9YT50_9ACTN|nr:hypothetical protein [Micromonospora endolithica]RKN38684.1 hypothetical protein D7223_30665 [Micromonospora endolithica]TWJ25301.1 hypothetical protein JD76_05464 [Micromonospora endolithica]